MKKIPTLILVFMTLGYFCQLNAQLTSTLNNDALQITNPLNFSSTTYGSEINMQTGSDTVLSNFISTSSIYLNNSNSIPNTIYYISNQEQ